MPGYKYRQFHPDKNNGAAGRACRPTRRGSPAVARSAPACYLGRSVAAKDYALPSNPRTRSDAPEAQADAAPAQRPDSATLARLIASKLDDDKAENILEIDLAGKSPLCDAMIVASGRSQRHVTALADHVARVMKDAGVDGVRVEGMPNADWVLIDGGDVIVHIFRPEVREFYNLERIWSGDTTSPHRNAGA